jgi:hypothetical protein
MTQLSLFPQPGASGAQVVKREWSSDKPGAFEICGRCSLCRELQREGKTVWR